MPGWGGRSLVLYGVSTLYFETGEGDGFRESGFAKERRLEPQITIGLLTGQDGFPLMVSAFEGNRAETKTMPVIEAFMTAHQLPDVTVVADAGMVSEANQKQIEAAGLSFILGMKIPHIPYVVKQWPRAPRLCVISGAAAGAGPPTLAKSHRGARYDRPDADPAPHGRHRLCRVDARCLTSARAGSGGGRASGGTEPRRGGLPRSRAGRLAWLTNACPGRAQVPLPRCRAPARLTGG